MRDNTIEVAIGKKQDIFLPTIRISHGRWPKGILLIDNPVRAARNISPPITTNKIPKIINNRAI
jgi:hypothetical protein